MSTHPVNAVPVIQPLPIDVKTPPGVGIGKKPHDRPSDPMVPGPPVSTIGN
jgi:hypothetical protein